MKGSRQVLHGDFGKGSLNCGCLYVLVRNERSLARKGTAKLLFQPLAADLELKRALGRIKRGHGEFSLKVIREHDRGLSISSEFTFL